MSLDGSVADTKDGGEWTFRTQSNEEKRWRKQ